jgi:SAM-dependent methyltransferase
VASSTPLPLPPPDLAARIGIVPSGDPLDWYVREGARLRGLIDELLPPGWDWEGKRALDFGCGSGRVLRHFATEASRAEFYGCDVDEPSIAWDTASLSPPFRFFLNTLMPPLELADGSLDLIWAMSVFTHISDTWSAWLLELHRVLSPGGILIASYLGEGVWPDLVQEPYREDEVGMAVLRLWEEHDAWVFHSEWWLREHWGRAFDVLAVRRPSARRDGSPEVTHSYIVLRRREHPPTRAELERIDPAEPREIAGLQTALRLARSEQMLLAGLLRTLVSRGERTPLDRAKRGVGRMRHPLQRGS